jgi:hypothetical protein
MDRIGPDVWAQHILNRLDCVSLSQCALATRFFWQLILRKPALHTLYLMHARDAQTHVELQRLLPCPTKPTFRLPYKSDELGKIIEREYPYASSQHRDMFWWRRDGEQVFYFKDARKAWLINDMYGGMDKGLVENAANMCRLFPAVVQRYWAIQFPRCMIMCLKGCTREGTANGDCCAMCFHRGNIFVIEINCPKKTKRARRFIQYTGALVRIEKLPELPFQPAYLQVNYVGTKRVEYVPYDAATVADIREAGHPLVLRLRDQCNPTNDSLLRTLPLRYPYCVDVIYDRRAVRHFNLYSHDVVIQ